MASYLDVQFNMAMSEEEIVDIGMVLDILLGIQHQVLTVFPQVNGIFALLVADVAMATEIEVKKTVRKAGRKAK